MASTDTEICNLALQRVRAESIGELTEDSAEADACNAVYDLLLEELLEAFSWPFAKASRALSLKAEEPVEWEYLFDYPNDCVMDRYLTFSGYNAEDRDAIPYEIILDSSGNKAIACNIDEPILIYTKKVTAVTLFSPSFVDCFAWRIAMDIAIPVGGESGAKYAENASTMFARKWNAATGLNANKGQRKQTRLPKAIAARHDTNRRRIYPDWRGV